MKIRSQNLLTSVPLFLFLAVTSSAMMYNAERREIKWGLQEEASSLAVAAAELIDGDRFRTEISRGTKSPYYNELLHVFDRLMKYDEAKRIFALTPDGRRVVFDFTYPPLTTRADARIGADSGQTLLRDLPPDLTPVTDP